jgi:hypothetical protein
VENGTTDAAAAQNRRARVDDGEDADDGEDDRPGNTNADSQRPDTNTVLGQAFATQLMSGALSGGLFGGLSGGGDSSGGGGDGGGDGGGN